MFPDGAHLFLHIFRQRASFTVVLFGANGQVAVHESTQDGGVVVVFGVLLFVLFSITQLPGEVVVVVVVVGI